VTTRWVVSYRADPYARRLADGHYSRRAVGAKQFVPPGRCVVLRTIAGDAYWVTSWQEYVDHRWPGAWMCSAFRNLSPHRSSELVVEAMAATRAVWPEPPRVPAWVVVGREPHRTILERDDIACVTFVDEDAVRRKRDPGRCFLRAGFEVVGRTRGGLVALGMRASRLPAPDPAMVEQIGLFPETRLH
jgi:hypothetical protein